MRLVEVGLSSRIYFVSLDGLDTHAALLGELSDVVPAHSSLVDLDDGDLKHHTDFRRVHAMLLERWLKIPAAPSAGKGFRPLEIV